MRKILLPIFIQLPLSFVFSQVFIPSEFDENGKIYAAKVNFQFGSQSSGYLNPDELNLDWSESDVNLSDNPDMDSWDVRLETQADNVFVVYNDNHTNGLQKIMYRKKISEDQWSDAIFVDAGGEIGERNNHLPAIATSNNGDLHVAYNVWAYENGRNYIGYSHYDAANETWEDGVKISDLGGTVDHFGGYKDVYSTEENYPVVIWGYDNRGNSINEEIYLTYYNGENWSEDIAVSDVTDNQSAGYPYMRGIGDQKAIIVYSEYVSNGVDMDLKFRIYDEQTHELSSPQIITSDNVMILNYVISSSENQVLVLKYFKMTSPDRDAFEIYEYDAVSNSFTLSSNTFEVSANAGGLLKRVDMDCHSSGDCGIIFTDYTDQNVSFLEYNATTGFGSPVIICTEDPQIDFPSAKFDATGNFHASWSDLRNDPGEGWMSREVIYKMGASEQMEISDVLSNDFSIYPNPSRGTFTIQTNDFYEIEIFNTSGQTVLERKINGTSHFQFSLPKGVYFIQLSNENKKFVKKLLIQ